MEKLIKTILFNLRRLTWLSWQVSLILNTIKLKKTPTYFSEKILLPRESRKYKIKILNVIWISHLYLKFRLILTYSNSKSIICIYILLQQGSEVVQYLHEQMDLWTLFSHDCKSTAYNMFCNNALHTT